MSEELVPFSAYRECPKCLGVATCRFVGPQGSATRNITTGTIEFWPCEHDPAPEHLHWTCECGYQWATVTA